MYLKVLVCGGRNFNDATLIYTELDRLLATHGFPPAHGCIDADAIISPGDRQTAVIVEIPMTVTTASTTAIHSSNRRRDDLRRLLGLLYRGSMVPSLVIQPGR